MIAVIELANLSTNTSRWVREQSPLYSLFHKSDLRGHGFTGC